MGSSDGDWQILLRQELHVLCPAILDDAQLKSSVTFMSLKPRMTALLLRFLRAETDAANIQMLLGTSLLPFYAVCDDKGFIYIWTSSCCKVIIMHCMYYVCYYCYGTF